MLDIPFDFPYAIVKARSLAAPTLELSDEMEATLGEVRSALLESSTLVAVRSMAELFAVTD